MTNDLKRAPDEGDRSGGLADTEECRERKESASCAKLGTFGVVRAGSGGKGEFV